MFNSRHILISFGSGVALLTMVFVSEYVLYKVLTGKGNPEQVSKLRKSTTEEISPSRERYLVKSPSCKIPDFNPFDLSLSQFVRRFNRSECHSRPPLTEVVYNPKTKRTSLEIIKDRVKFYSKRGDLRCCAIVVKEDYSNIVLSDCIYFGRKWNLEETFQSLFVSCRTSNENIVYTNVHITVRKIKDVKPKRDKTKLNVLLIGLDSMSRLNLYRTMPKTTTYLHTRGWTELRGYNKVADNTLPNLMAILTGQGPEDFTTPHLRYFDKQPFIWKEFSAANYVTVYAEDKYAMGTFDCNMKGFFRKPTDHCPRNSFFVGETNAAGGESEKFMGFKTPSDHLLDYLVDFARVYKDDSFFGLFWVNSFSHNNLNQPSSEDTQVLRVLQSLESLGTLNSTMVIFLSDHGLRVGSLRKTKIGWYEDRLPFLFISLPQWYKDQNSLEYLNLLKSVDTLTSPYDIYTTLSYVLHDRNLKTPKGCKTCRNLLSGTPPPRDRSCSQAGIPPHWCTCHELSDLPLSSPNTFYWANMVVEAINAKLKSAKGLVYGYVCQPLTLWRVLYFRKKRGSPGLEYVVGVQTSPRGAQFEGTVVRTGYLDSVDDPISRLDEYGEESHCAMNPLLKLFCHCVDVL